MSPGKVAWDVFGTKTRSGFTGVKSAAGLSPQPSRGESTTEPSPQPSRRRAESTSEVMVIDKSWTLLERHEKAFYTGLTKFVDDCKSLVNIAGNIKCPCKSCRTVLWVSIENLPKHITRYGWDPALLNDLSYIPSNNEQNEPTQGDIELYANANEELYPGYDYVTRLDFMAKFTYFKVKGKLTDSIFIEMLEFFQHVFPTMKGYKLPSSYYAIKKTFKTIGLGYESIHACVNDCFLFRGDNNKDVHFCLVCKTSRWKDSNTPGKKVPKKVLRYFLIIPRLQRLYKFSHTAKEMTWHATRKCTEPESSFMLTLLILGPKSSGKDIDVYLRPLIDDLKVLWALKGVETIDVTTGHKFNMRVMVLWTINDFHARSSLSGIDILCNLELIYPPALFDIMIHLVIHLPLEALEGGPIRPLWMFPFERFTEKLKGYVRNKAKAEGSIAEGYVAEEALTFSSHYFWDVTTKFNRPDRNADPPPLTCQFQVFRSLCKSIGLRSVIRFDTQELKKVIWYVLHNSPEIDTYRSQFKKHERRILRLVWVADNNPSVSTTTELFALAYGPTPTPISVNSCVVNGVRFVVHSRDERRTTQNSGICSPGWKDEEMYYGQLQEILEFSYLSFKVVLFRVKWFETSNEGLKVKHLVLRNNMTQILTKEEDPDVIHFENSSDLPLSTSLNDLDNATLHIDGQSTKVDAPAYIIDLDEDNDIIDDEEALPHNLADSDDEDLINVDDDDGVDMSADVARGHGGGGGSDDRPPTHHIPTGCKGTRNPNLGRRKAGRLHSRQETRNLGLKKITNDKGPVLIRFEWDDKKTLMPLGDHASHWSNYLGELIRETTLYYPSWQKVSAKRKATILTKIETQFDLTPHMKSQRWTNINAGIQHHLQNFYNTNKASLKAAHWVINPKTGIDDVEDMESSATREYPSLIHTFFVTHTVNGVFTRDVDRAIYEEMLRLQALGSNTPSGVPYTKEEINALARKGKQRGHLPGVSRVNLMMKLFRSNDKFSQMLNQYESTPEFGNASGSGGCVDDEMESDEDGGEDEEDEEDDDS
nr:hypothetical protein [Tanacetum cinerariifolium]